MNELQNSNEFSKARDCIDLKKLLFIFLGGGENQRNKKSNVKMY